MGYDNPLQNEYEGFRQRAARIEGDWCDNCHGYTHMPYCPDYEEPRREHSPLPWQWLPSEGQFIVDAQGNVVGEIPCQGCNPSDGAFIVESVNQHQHCATQLRFLGNRAEELSSLLAGMTTERDEMREAIERFRARAVEMALQRAAVATTVEAAIEAAKISQLIESLPLVETGEDH